MNITSVYPTLSLESLCEPGSFTMITITDGPGVNGLKRYFRGYSHKDIRDDDGSFLARLVGHHELPRPMT